MNQSDIRMRQNLCRRLSAARRRQKYEPGLWRVACVAPMFPFCEIVFFYARISFLRIFPLCVAANWGRQHFFAENTRRKETNNLLCINLDTKLGNAPKRIAPKWKRANEKRAEVEARQRETRRTRIASKLKSPK